MYFPISYFITVNVIIVIIIIINNNSTLLLSDDNRVHSVQVFIYSSGGPTFCLDQEQKNKAGA